MAAVEEGEAASSRGRIGRGQRREWHGGSKGDSQGLGGAGEGDVVTSCGEQRKERWWGAE